MVSTFYAFETSDPRDTIYAVLALANDTAPFEGEFAEIWLNGMNTNPSMALDTRIVPDYSKSLIDVCTDFIDFCLDKSKSLDIICRPWITGTLGHKPLPAWIPCLKDSAFGELGMGWSGRVNGDSFVGTPNHNGTQL